MTTDVAEPKPAPPAWESQRRPGPWAVEIMGHRVRAGSLSDAQFAGTAMLRVQHPTMPDHAELGPLTECFGSAAIFGIRPCSREEATQWAEARWRSPQLATAMAELESIHELDDWEDEND